MIGELRFRTRITTIFWRDICAFVRSYCKTCRLYKDILHIKWLLYYRSCLFSRLEACVLCNKRVMALNIHHSVYLITQLCVLTHIIEIYRSYMNVLHIKWLLCYQGDSLCDLDLHEGSYWRATTANMHRFCMMQHCVCILQVMFIHCYVFGVQRHWQQSSSSLWLLYSPNNSFSVKIALLLTNFASYSTHSSYFQLTVYTIIKFTKSY